MNKESPPPFDVAKVTEMFKNVQSLSDLTGSNGIIQEMARPKKTLKTSSGEVEIDVPRDRKESQGNF